MNPAHGPAQQQPASSELAAALGACRRAFVATAVFSGMSNLLMLTGALFMLEVYDRILPSRSVPTLVALLFLVAGLYAAQGMIDTIRSRILVRVGHSLDESMSARVYDAIVRLPLKIGGKGDGTQPIRDLDSVRGFLSGSGPVAFFDFALDAGLSRDLFFVPHFNWSYRTVRRPHPHYLDNYHRGQDSSSDPKRRAICRRAQRAVGGKPAQCRGDHGHGHGRPHRQALA